MEASKKKVSIALAAVLGLGAVGYWMQGANSAQGRGVLAQAPLNVTSGATPAFIIAADDSGSMVFETLFARDEEAYWGNTNDCLNGNSACPNGFFNADGTLRSASAGGGRGNYYHVIQNGIRLDKVGNNAVDTGTAEYRLGIPPLDLFGFARSPDYNDQYFDPSITYDPWMRVDKTLWANASITAARSDPRADGAAGVRGPNPVVTYNFQATEARTSDYFAFRFQPGMRLPAGTEYFIRSARHPNGCGGLGTNNASRDNWVTVGASGHLITNSNNLNYGNPNDRGGGCEIHIKYFPAVVYLKNGTAPPPGFDLSKRVSVPNAGGPGVALWKYELRPENFTSGYAQVIQNFANWYTYHGNRNRSTIGALTHALEPMNNLRVGYFSINKRSGNQPGMAGGNLLMRDLSKPAEKSLLYDNLVTLPADGGTPNRSATVYMGDQFRRTDGGAPVKYSCQKNAGMLFTDGYTNENVTNGNAYRSFGDTDSGQPRPIGGNANGNTLADIAYSYYKDTLRSDLTQGKVPVADVCRNADGTLKANPPLDADCQTNPHMNFYGITLGARGEIHGVNVAATNDPYTTYPNWVASSSTNSSPRNVDDIWHAAINTRGEYISVKRPSDVTDAMRRVLSSVTAGVTPSGSIGLTGARVGNGSLAVEPAYEVKNNGTDWFGTLTASRVTADPVSGVLQLATAWEAANLLTGTSGSRRIFVGKTSGSVVPSTFEFNSTNVTLNELCAGALSRCIGTGTGRTSISGGLGITNSQAIAYLRGDQTLEASSTTPLRKRSRVLGDIVNSTPVVISPFNDYGYRSLRGTSPGSTDPYNYAAYLETKKTRPQMVFVGANDGMLHAFRGDSGVEQFAYIPAAALGHMGNLLFPYRVEDKNDQVFQHRYFVDGPIVVSDAHVGSGWKTTLVGTLGAGGKGVFGLDVSTPGTFAASNVMFDINDKASTAAIRDNIGHVLSRPVIVPVKVGANVRWKAIFGNGYNSTNNRAVLFIVDLANPTGAGGVVMVEATEASQTEANGLGGIIAVDRFVGSTTTAGRDGYADTVYGADQNGAIWKFDLRSSTPAALTTPFFTATDASGARQAITGGLEAAAGPRGGVMLYFGTGSFSFVNDPADRQVQSFYGVLDTGTPVSRAELHEQSIILDEDGNRDTTMLPMPANKKGWFIDLRVGATATGERMVGTPRVESGIIFFPAFDPTSTDGCATGGTNRLYGLAALSGAAAMSSVRQGSPTGEAYGEPTGAVKLSTTGSAPVTDIAIMTSPRTSPLAAGTTDEDLDDALGARCSMVVRAPGSDLLYLRRPCGRQSWRQVR